MNNNQAKPNTEIGRSAVDTAGRIIINEEAHWTFLRKTMFKGLNIKSVGFTIRLELTRRLLEDLGEPIY